jgi:hypothetical protein
MEPGSAGRLGSVVAGSGARAECDGECGTTGTGLGELGVDGSAGTAVCRLAVPLAITSAMSNAITSTVTVAAAIHSQRGAFGFSGSGSCGG